MNRETSRVIAVRLSLSNWLRLAATAHEQKKSVGKMAKALIEKELSNEANSNGSK